MAPGRGRKGGSQVRAVTTARRSWQEPKPLKCPLAQGRPLQLPQLPQLRQPELMSFKAASPPPSSAWREGGGGGAGGERGGQRASERGAQPRTPLCMVVPDGPIKKTFSPDGVHLPTMPNLGGSMRRPLLRPSSGTTVPITPAPHDHHLRGRPWLHLTSVPG